MEAQTVRLSKRDVQDVERAIRALDRIADRHRERDGGDWHHYDFDTLSSARAAISQWLWEHEEA